MINILHFQGKVFSTHIRNAITLAEAPTQGQEITNCRF